MSTAESEPALQGGGECGALLRGLDWDTNPLGPPSGWSSELTAVVGIAMASAQPILIVWGPEQTTLYNDGYAAMCGLRHPAALGKPFKDLWFDIWDTVEPIITAAYAGVSTSMDDIKFTMMRNGYPEETHFAFSYNPVRDRSGKVLGMICPCTETTAAVATQRAQNVERSAFMQIFEVGLGAIALLSGPDHVFRYINPEYQALIDNRDVIGRSVRLALPEVVGQGFIELLDKVYSSGEHHVGRGVPIHFQRIPGGPTETRMVDFLYHPIRDEKEDVTGIFVQAMDVTERIEAEQQQILLNRELGHRMKNQYAMVQAIINQTLRSATDLASVGSVLNGRIHALSTAHDLLIEGKASRTSVSDIVHSVLALNDDRDETRFTISGPSLIVASKPALSLSLILHELWTNAMKHGALSTAQGHITIKWQVVRNPSRSSQFVLSWTEHGGPPVTEPQRSGTGTRLIMAGLGGVLDGRVSLEYPLEGLRCEISADLSTFQSDQ